MQRLRDILETLPAHPDLERNPKAALGPNCKLPGFDAEAGHLRLAGPALAWRLAAGEIWAHQTRFVDLRDGVFSVAVSEPSLRLLIESVALELCSALNRSLGPNRVRCLKVLVHEHS